MIPTDDVERRLIRRGLRPRWTSPAPSGFRGVAVDSRTVRRGDLFCAIPGTRTDGHDFVEDAARAGAAGAVVERLLEDAPVPCLLVADARAAAAHLASLYHGDPGDRLWMAGITGTNGKTTTAWLVRHLLAADRPAAALGTLGLARPDGRLVPGRLTTPDPVELMETLEHLAEAGTEALAMEVSSHALDQRRVDALRFDVAVFTSFSREHLDYHASMEAYREAKLRLTELLEPGGLLLVNADEPAWQPLLSGERLAAAARGPAAARAAAEKAGRQAGGGAELSVRVRTFGLAATAGVRADEVVHRADGSSFTLLCPEGRARVELPFPGEFNVLNALAAAGVALGAGLDAGTVARRLSSAPAVPGRMEVLRREPSLVVRDYAHTADAYDRVLSMLRGLARGRLFVVFGCGGDRDAGKRPGMGRAAARHADLLLVTTDNPRSEDPAEIARQVVADLDPSRYRLVLDRREAIGQALELAGPEDVVALLGKGHETYQHVGDEKVPFDEAAVVRELTEAMEGEDGPAGEGA